MGRGSARGAYSNGGGNGRGKGGNYKGNGGDNYGKGDRRGYVAYDYGGNDRGRRDARGSGGAAAAAEARIPAVDQDRWYCKRALLPYLSTRGSWFNRIGGASNDTDVMDTRQIAGRSSHMNCEAMNRPGKWISMVAGIPSPHKYTLAIAWTISYTFDFFACTRTASGRILNPSRKSMGASPGTLEKAVEDMKKKPAPHTADLLAYFDSPEGRSVLEACAILNYNGKTKLPTSSDVQQSLVDVFHFFSLKPRMADMKHVALHSAKQYVNAMNILESYSLLGNRQHWAHELAQQMERHPRALKEFIVKPADDEALIKGILGCVMQNIREEQRNALGEGDAAERFDEEDAPMSDQGEDRCDNDEEKGDDFDEEPPARPTRSGFSLGAKFSLSTVATPLRQNLGKPNKKIEVQADQRERSRSPVPAKASALVDALEEASDNEEDFFRAHWDSDGVQALAVFVKEWKTENKNLKEVKEAVEKVPAQVLKRIGLEDLPKRLAGFTRMPRKAGLNSVVDKLVAAAESGAKCFETPAAPATPTLESLFDDDDQDTPGAASAADQPKGKIP